MALSVLLVEDIPELRSVIRQTLRLRGGFEVVGEAADGASAIAAAASHQPDIVVLDLGLPDLAGHEVLTRLRAVSPVAQVVVYTGSFTPDRTPVAGQVEAFLTKDQDVAYLVDLLSRLGRRRYDTAALAVGSDPREVGGARRFLSDQCRAWGCGDLTEDAELVASELVTNALLHGAGQCEFRVALSDAALRIQVIDHGAGMPDPRTAGHRDEQGRGLLLVSALCAAWGVEALPGGGKMVWAELLRPLVDPGPDPARGTPADARAAWEPSDRPAGDGERPEDDTPPPPASASLVASAGAH